MRVGNFLHSFWRCGHEQTIKTGQIHLEGEVLWSFVDVGWRLVANIMMLSQSDLAVFVRALPGHFEVHPVWHGTLFRNAGQPTGFPLDTGQCWLNCRFHIVFFQIFTLYTNLFGSPLKEKIKTKHIWRTFAPLIQVVPRFWPACCLWCPQHLCIGCTERFAQTSRPVGFRDHLQQWICRQKLRWLELGQSGLPEVPPKVRGDQVLWQNAATITNTVTCCRKQRQSPTEQCMPPGKWVPSTPSGIRELGCWPSQRCGGAAR